MLSLEPLASLALPPISPRGLSENEGAWTLTEKRGPGPSAKAKPKSVRSPDKKKDASSEAALVGSTSDEGQLVPGAREAIAEQNAEIAHEAAHIASGITLDGSTVAGARLGSHSPPQADKTQRNAMKGRAIETWLNHTLGSSITKPTASNVSRAGGGSMQGLSQFGIDTASLERLGLDSQSAERVYRAMFVYSQGLHAVLQEAVGKSNSASRALLVLWRAFTTVLEHAGQSEEQGAESLAALVARGNEEEKARLKSEFDNQIGMLQVQAQRLTVDRRDLQQEIQKLREDEARLRNDNEMYRNDNHIAVSKYEREIKERLDAEVRLRDKIRWADALQEDLNKERKQCMHLTMKFQDASAEKETLKVELDQLRLQGNRQDAQVAAFKQYQLEAAQQKQRYEQQVEQHTHSILRANNKIHELKDQLEKEVEQNKKTNDAHSTLQREMRKLETQYEDETHSRKECQNERDSLRERVEKMDRDASELTEQGRIMRKEMNDLSMKHRTDQIELGRLSAQNEKQEKKLDELEIAHTQLVDAHRALNVEAEYLREDVKHCNEQLAKESDLRKHLQHEKKQLTGQLQTVQIERDSSITALHGAQNELQEVTEKLVKLESIVRDTKSSMQKIGLEHQVELKAYTQKASMLERSIADERNARRSLVNEVQEVVAKREETLAVLEKKDIEIQQLKQHRFEKEEEADRYKILLNAQMQRNKEQLVTVDKYHGAVRSHDAEMREMQVLLDSERKEAQRQLAELQVVYAATRHTLDLEIGSWKMSYEDVLSRLNFNPAADKIKELSKELDDLRRDLKEKAAFIAAQVEKTANREAEISKRDARVRELKTELENTQEELEQWKAKCAQHLLALERQSLARCDAEQQTERIKQNNEAFDTMKANLENKISCANLEIEQLTAELNKPKADAQVEALVSVAENSSQTDLSFQYLESSQNLQNDPKRRERLDALHKASHFVDAPDKRSDQSVTRSSGPASSAMAATVELTFEANPKAAIRNLVYSRVPKAMAAAGPPVTSAEPWPSPPVGRSPGRPAPSAQALATARSNKRQPEAEAQPTEWPAPQRVLLKPVSQESKFAEASQRRSDSSVKAFEAPQPEPEVRSLASPPSHRQVSEPPEPEVRSLTSPPSRRQVSEPPEPEVRSLTSPLRHRQVSEPAQEANPSEKDMQPVPSPPRYRFFAAAPPDAAQTGAQARGNMLVSAVRERLGLEKVSAR